VVGCVDANADGARADRRRRRRRARITHRATKRRLASRSSLSVDRRCSCSTRSSSCAMCRVRSALPAAGTGGACDACPHHRAAHANRGIEARRKRPYVGQIARIHKVTTPGNGMWGMCIQDFGFVLWRIHLPRTSVNRPEARLRPLDASRALPPTQGRSLLLPPIRPAPPCSASVQGTPYSQ
jgi:hypothetical protein